MTLKTQKLTLIVFFDDAEHDPPATWSWSDLTGAQVGLVGLDQPKPLAESCPECGKGLALDYDTGDYACACGLSWEIDDLASAAFDDALLETNTKTITKGE